MVSTVYEKEYQRQLAKGLSTSTIDAAAEEGKVPVADREANVPVTDEEGNTCDEALHQEKATEILNVSDRA
ncbi:MAG: hypothetical protein LQ338_002257 [Usnochroma carphineum]|nr:MAG: hypothetical protein LQ338_002257 [Usnochroma carphineum]